MSECEWSDIRIGKNGEVIYVGDFGVVTFPTLTAADLPVRPRRGQGMPVDSAIPMSERLRNCWGASSVDHFSACTVASLTAPDNVQHAAEVFLSNFRLGAAARRGLLIYGETGVGKTYCAAALANELMGYGYRCLAAKVEALIRMDSAELRRQMARLTARETDLVVIDDFGSERQSGFGIASLHQIVDELYTSGVTLLVTTNLTRSQIAKPASVEAARPLDRLKERCKCVEYKGPNQRQRQLAHQEEAS